MKHAIATVMTALLLPQPTVAQAVTAAQVPVAVKRAVAARFPGAGPVEWKIKSDKNYEAEFKLKGVDIAAKFDSTAKWLETETTVARATIPAPVRDTVAKNFKGYKIVETQTVQRWNEQ